MNNLKAIINKKFFAGSILASNIVFVAASLTILFWSTSYVGIRVAVRYYSPEALALLRFLAASIFLLVFAVAAKIKLPDFADIPLILINGFIGFFLYNWALNMGTKTVTAGISSFLISTAPIFTCIFSILFLKEKLHIWGWAGIMLSLSGIAIITLTEKNNTSFNSGILLVLFASILISLYNILLKRLLTKYKPIEATTYCIWSGTLFMFIFIPKLLNQLPCAPIQIDLIIVYLGLFPAALGYILWSYALSKAAKTGYVASFMYLTPVLTIIISGLAIKEIPQLYSIVGGVIVLAGVILTNTAKA